MITNKKSYLPTQNLRPFIDRYWTYVSEGNDPLEALDIFPGTGCDLVFHLQDVPDEIKSGCSRKLDRNYLVCPREGTSHIHYQQRTTMVGVRFKSWAFTNFSNVPIARLKNQFVAATSIWDKELVSGLLDQINNAYKHESFVSVLDDFLLGQLELNYKNNPNLYQSIDKLYYLSDTINVGTASEMGNLSNRHYRRLFSETMGVTPKRFQRIVRFQNIMKSSMLNQKIPVLDDILRFGYFDQSHFIKDFKYFTDQSPGTFFGENINKSHFYNSSIR